MSDTKDYMRHVRPYLQPAFLLCVTILALSAGSMSIAIKKFGVYLKKEPIQLRKSFDFLDENGLGTYNVISKQKIQNSDVIQALGTKNYVQWILQDTTVAEDSPVRNCFLFITYYDLPNRVPHVPEECYAGAGNQRLASDSLVLKVDFEGEKKEIPARYLVFLGSEANIWVSSNKFPVLYLFNINGDYAGNREDARIALNKNILGKYSYFSKVEWNFFNSRFGSKVYPDKEQAIVASEKLLEVILPVLEKEHWPNVDKVEKNEK